jgi:hypothetical protein
MGTTSRSVLVRRPVEEVAKSATDPGVVLPALGALGRVSCLDRHPDGTQEWDLFVIVGTIHVGGRVLIENPSWDRMAWRSLRGKRHTARVDVAPADDGATITMSVTTEFAGALSGPLTGLLAGPILGRYLEATLEQLRHRIEYGP